MFKRWMTTHTLALHLLSHTNKTINCIICFVRKHVKYYVVLYVRQPTVDLWLCYEVANCINVPRVADALFDQGQKVGRNHECKL